VQQYITSDNCVGCHGGLGGAPSGVSQFIKTGPGYGKGWNISPYGEWRWSPMGLAGRDPIFHSQIETELLILLQENGLLTQQSEAADSQLKEVRIVQQALVDTCLRCHGAMGLRQQGLNQTAAEIDAHSINFSQSPDPIQKLLTQW
jgi:mono/diheme cytochrome c family protein